MPDYEVRVQSLLPSPSKLFTPGVTGIIALMIAGFLLLIHARDFTLSHLALSPGACVPGTMWQLISYSLINGPGGLVLNGLIVLFLGSNIEREWRTRSFVLLWLVISVVCGVLWLLANLIFDVNYLGMSSGACSYGLIAVYGLIFRRRRFFALLASVEVQHLALILFAIGILLCAVAPMSLIWVAGAAVAFFYVKLRWRVAAGLRAIEARNRGCVGPS